MSNSQSAPQFDDACGVIEYLGKRLQFRPKTYAVARVLAQNSGSIVTKEALMEAVWGTNIVEEQAVFQSINEIRRAFKDVLVIRTFPKRGYRWELPQKELSNTELATGQPIKKQRYGAKSLFMIVFILVSLATILGISLYSQHNRFSFISEDNTNSEHLALLLLPTDMSQLTSEEKWLGYGAMQAIIERIPGQSHGTIFQPADVLDIMRRKTVEDVTDYFQVSGATHIVSSKVIGVPGDFALLYSIDQRNGAQSHGVLHAKTLGQLIDAYYEALMLTVFNELTRPQKPLPNLLGSTLMYRAMTLLGQGAVQEALPYLQSSLAEQPDNAIGHYLLAKSYLQLDQYNAAYQQADIGLELLKDSDEQSLKGRFYYLQGVAMIDIEHEQAAQLLKLAETETASQKDWLYHAYAQAMQGKLLINASKFRQAQPLLESSMRYQQLLNCPLGMIQAHLDWVDYYFALGDLPNAHSELAQATLIAEQRGLSQALPILEESSEKLKNQQDKLIEQL